MRKGVINKERNLEVMYEKRIGKERIIKTIHDFETEQAEREFNFLLIKKKLI